MTKRVALMGMHLEANSFAPTTTEQDFRTLCYMAGDEMLADIAKENPSIPAEITAFHAEMNTRGMDWEPVPILITGAEPGGPVDEAFFQRTKAEMQHRLRDAGAIDGVFCSLHGAMTSTGGDDPDGELLEMVRDLVGPDVPILSTLDLHANISERMVEKADVLVSYITNPHVDQAERAQESADLMCEIWDGMKPEVAFIRLPLVSPSVVLLSAEGPYADLINYGQQMQTDTIANVSVVAGFVYSNTPMNGIAVIVTARGDKQAARALAADIAERGWADRTRFRKDLTSLDDAVSMMKANGEDESRPGQIFADVADNPGGGGRGNTTYVLKALVEAGVQHCLFAVFHDPALVRAAQAAGEGGRFDAVFNAETESEFSQRFEAPAQVLGLHDGKMVGTLGIWAGRSIDVGPMALLQVGGVKLVVITNRKQCADPVFFQAFGLDVAKARSVVVKSRGHFRAGFAPYFDNAHTFEIDVPGLTSPVLKNFNFDRLPRPVYSLDEDATWAGPAWTED
ncbi:MAG: M81 family metallopeptidase [Rhodospirillaceae bacterium]|nr:M81 family metallopeptidase [Rhodospirillaceae bacterium]